MRWTVSGDANRDLDIGEKHHNTRFGLTTTHRILNDGHAHALVVEMTAGSMKIEVQTQRINMG